MKLDSRYADYFPEYLNCFGRALILLKSIYGMPNYGKLFADELTEWLLEAFLFDFNVICLSIISMHQMGKNLFVLSYVDEFIY